MVKKFKLIIEYDGTDYHGWQRQPAEKTIQAEIESALAVMTRKRVAVYGAGRTDAGVHALAQAAHFSCDTHLGPDTFLKGLNSLLPEDIAIKACERVDPGFHARYDARRKVYQYRILNRPIRAAIDRRYAWHIRRPLNAGYMRSAATLFVGKHDFKAFEGTGSPRSQTIRQVCRTEIAGDAESYLLITIEASGFLRHMARNIVGTLVDVGWGKFKPEDVAAILLSRDRGRAGATAPARGLFLARVIY
jgi:tRNA pseudouridine38-40 synthase